MKKARICGILLFLIFSLAFVASAEIPYETYTYSFQGEIQSSPHAFYPQESISLANTDAGPMKNPSDIVCFGDMVLVADTGNNRVLVLDKGLKLVKELSVFIDSDGKTGSFNQPQGVFVASDGTLYVADTMNGRIVSFNSDFSFQQYIGLPESKLIDEKLVYRPVGVAVDAAERLYIVSQNVNMGVMVMDKNGRFYGYIGAQKVTVSMTDLIRRRFMTEEQRDRIKSVVPTEYNDITIDEEGFLFVTTNALDAWQQYNAAITKSRASDFAPIRKLNSSGTDILPRNGFYPPAGDLKVEFGYGPQYGPSSIVEVALGENGVFSMVDARRNKIFTYDADGRLLYIFGSTGSSIGAFQNLVSIAYQGDRLLALDCETNRITVFQRTEYGDLINDAIGAYNRTEFAKSSEIWASLADYNNNLDLAYIGLGDASFREKKYEDALSYYQKTVNIEGYSKALNAMRKDWLSQNFFWVLLVTLAILVSIVFLFSKIAKFNRAGDYKTKYSLWDQLLYAFHILLHPFNGFDEIKSRKRGSLLSATILLILVLLANIFKETSSGYVFIGQTINHFDLLISVCSLGLPVLLWCTASWCLTSLMDGKGTFKDIYISTCYSLFPLALLYIPMTIISNVMTLDEAAVYAFVGALAVGWTLALIFFGTLTIHDYSLGKNIVTVILSIVGMVIIIFLGVLFFNLIQKMIILIANLITEISYRI